jgi:hypothetical protein
MWTLWTLIAVASPAEADPQLARMTALYERVCLKTFPDDRAVAALMLAEAAREFTPAEVKVTMRDDPARGWELPGATVWIEFPPYHACSVRWNAPRIRDLSGYRAVANRFERSVGGFRPIAPFDSDQGDIHVHGVGEQRILPDQSAEALFIFDQQINDPKRRAAGDTGVVLRFVHQFAPAPEADGK